MPQALAARLAALIITTVATTVIPVAVQDRPILRWTWGKLGPTIETRVRDRVDNRINPPEVKVDVKIDTKTIPPPVAPQVNPPKFREVPVAQPSRPVLNPNDYCRRHWWKAGPVRWIVSLPFRIFR